MSTHTPDIRQVLFLGRVPKNREAMKYHLGAASIFLQRHGNQMICKKCDIADPEIKKYVSVTAKSGDQAFKEGKILWVTDGVRSTSPEDLYIEYNGNQDEICKFLETRKDVELLKNMLAFANEEGKTKIVATCKNRIEYLTAKKGPPTIGEDSELVDEDGAPAEATPEPEASVPSMATEAPAKKKPGRKPKAAKKDAFDQ